VGQRISLTLSTADEPEGARYDPLWHERDLDGVLSPKEFRMTARLLLAVHWRLLLVDSSTI
jgi:hypothetical protein